MKSSTIRLMLLFLVSLLLTILPLPETMLFFKPPWILLLILYTQYYLPEQFSIPLLIIFGLVLDSLMSSVIGEHTFALVITTWIANNKVRRFCLFSTSQQLGLIAAFVCIYQLIILTIDAYLGFHANMFVLIGSMFTSILLWPLIRLLGEDLKLVTS